MNWGLRITLLYGGFVAMMLTLVFLSMREKVDLVSKDYYEKELNYQDQIARIKRTSEMSDPLRWSLDGNELSVFFPKEYPGEGLTGEIYLFRPSNSENDKRFTILPDKSGTQRVPLDGIVPGHYKLKIEWASGDKTFYNEAVIAIP